MSAAGSSNVDLTIATISEGGGDGTGKVGKMDEKRVESVGYGWAGAALATQKRPCQLFRQQVDLKALGKHMPPLNAALRGDGPSKGIRNLPPYPCAKFPSECSFLS